MSERVEVSKVKLDKQTQQRVNIDYDVVSEYRECIEDLPPVVVFFDGSDYWLADGYHRYHAYRTADKEEIPADVRQGSRRDAILYSVGANTSHGLRRTNADKRKAVITLLQDEEWSKWSNREIARRCGVVHGFVNKLKSSLDIESSDTDTSTKYRTKHGTISTMRTGNIGGREESATPKTPTSSQTSYTAPQEEQEEERYIESPNPLYKESQHTEDEPPKMAYMYVEYAQSQLERIEKDMDCAADALMEHIGWVQNKILSIKQS